MDSQIKLDKKYEWTCIKNMPAPPPRARHVVVCWALADYSMANRKIAYTLGRGRAYIFDMSSTSGYMGEKYFQEFGPRFFDMSSASGYMGEKYFQEFGPRFLACHVIFGVSCSKCCVSWRVNIYRVNKFRVVSCQNSACQRVHAMSWPPWIQMVRNFGATQISSGHGWFPFFIFQTNVMRCVPSRRLT